MEEGKSNLEGSGLMYLSLWGEEVDVCSSILVEDI